MSKPRSCPHCNQQIPLDQGYSFDDDLNLVCGYCDGVIYPGTDAAETLQQQALNRPPVPPYQQTYQQNTWQRNNQAVKPDMVY